MKLSRAEAAVLEELRIIEDQLVAGRWDLIRQSACKIVGIAMNRILALNKRS
jgi:hypothetical protein